MARTVESFKSAGYGAEEAYKEAAQRLGHLPTPLDLEDLGAAIGKKDASLADIPLYVERRLETAANAGFVRGYLDDFFAYVPETQLVARTRSFQNVADEIADEEQANAAS